MQVNINGISSKVFSLTGMLIMLLAAVTDHWRKKDIKGKAVHESVWEDCAILETGQTCYLTKKEQGLNSTIGNKIHDDYVNRETGDENCLFCYTKACRSLYIWYQAPCNTEVNIRLHYLKL